MLAVVPIVLLACCALLFATNTDVSVFVAVNGAGRLFSVRFLGQRYAIRKWTADCRIVCHMAARPSTKRVGDSAGCNSGWHPRSNIEVVFRRTAASCRSGDAVHVIGPAYQHTSFPSGDAITIFLLAAISTAHMRRCVYVRWCWRAQDWLL